MSSLLERIEARRNKEKSLGIGSHDIDLYELLTDCKAALSQQGATDNSLLIEEFEEENKATISFRVLYFCKSGTGYRTQDDSAFAFQEAIKANAAWASWKKAHARYVPKAVLSQQGAVVSIANDDRKLSDIGNEIHNIGCGLQASHEEYANELGLLASELWFWGKTNPQPQKVESEPEIEEGSETKGMNLGERIAHVGGRENAAGYIEFGSVMAVEALIIHVLRDIDRPSRPTAQEDKLIEERDYWEEKATDLADAVGKHFGVDIGEHTSANCPIEEAHKILDGEYKTNEATISRLLERVRDGIELVRVEMELYEAATDEEPPAFHLATIGLLRSCEAFLSQPDKVPQSVEEFIEQYQRKDVQGLYGIPCITVPEFSAFMAGKALVPVEVIATLRNNVRDKDAGVRRVGIHDNDKVRKALSQLFDEAAKGE